MKTKIAQMQVARLFSILTCAALLAGPPARACTVFCDSQGDTVLAGRSLDIPDNPHLGMLLEPATAKRHGWVCFGRFDYPWADGMNDQGLFIAVADVPTPYKTRTFRQPADLQTFLSGLLANCASVDEAITWCQKQPTPHLGGWVNHSFLGYYTFITLQHILVADRTGDSVVLEWEHGRLKATRKHDRYQLMTNFLLSDPEAGYYPCPRYLVDAKIFNQATEPSLQTSRQVLETTATGLTRYSLICDLKHGDVHVYLRRYFDQPKTFHLADELRKGRHQLDLDQWFGRPKPEPLSPPPATAPSTITAAEVLQRALIARGGGQAAAAIRSLHGKGTVDIDQPCLPALPTEYFAMRPSRYRSVTELISPAGPDLGQDIEGFDGRTGWNAYPGCWSTSPDGSCTILQAEPYQLRQDEAAFFGWYDEPGKPGTAECLGEVQFDGKSCYELKVLSPTRHEYYEYYDTTNFLLAGTFVRGETQDGLGWVKTTLGDFRAFAGFLLPTSMAWQDDTGSYSTRFSSFEINTVTEKDLQMAEKDTRLKQ